MGMGQELPLRDIHGPPAPGLWPPAPGWWVLVGLLLLLLVLLVRTLHRRYGALRRRREILEELAALRGRDAGADLAAEVSALLKRVALARFPRSEVASLTGQAWVEFLDRNGGGGRFVSGPGRSLAEGPYAPAPRFDPEDLLALAGDWIRRNT
jgi:hypothetical protein